jgi:hypothetical protein
MLGMWRAGRHGGIVCKKGKSKCLENFRSFLLPQMGNEQQSNIALDPWYWVTFEVSFKTVWRIIRLCWNSYHNCSQLKTLRGAYPLQAPP